VLAVIITTTIIIIIIIVISNEWIWGATAHFKAQILLACGRNF
jgi:hypothetical protein